MEKPRHIGAFKESLIPHAEHANKTKEKKLYQPEGRSDVVVRPLEWEEDVERGYFNPKGIEEISAESYARITKEHLDELRSHGIESPVQFVVAQRDKEATAEDKQREVYAIVDTITPAADPNQSEMGKEFARIRAGLLAYYTDKFEKEESFLADLTLDTQYVYGKKPNDQGPDHLYLVDIEPYIYQGNGHLLLLVGAMIAKLTKESNYFDNFTDYEPVIKGFKGLENRIEEALKEDTLPKAL